VDRELQMARGGFDPKLMVDYQSKDYKTKNYYDLLDAYVKVPTWIGVDIQGGYQRNVGLDLNSIDNTADGDGYYYLGASVPVGAGLFMDQRRAVMRQAQIGINIGQAEADKLYFKLLLQVNKDYWAWYESWQNLQNIQFGYDLAIERYEAVKVRAMVGDLARIDTVEALITVQDRRISLRQAQLDLQQARLALEVHLWGDDDQPRILKPSVQPFLAPTATLRAIKTTEELLDLARSNHPEIRKLQGKLDQLEIDRRLSVENLKPVINLKYNFLSTLAGSPETRRTTFSTKDYKFGIEASMPLFLRKERGKLGLTKIKLTDTQLELVQQRRQIENEVKAAAAELTTLEELVGQQARMVTNYQTLRDGEVDKFLNGESSLFLVNSRESKLIEGKVKLTSLQSKYQKARAYLLWSAGQAPE
jgi:outer membrane protein TolC